MNTGFPPAKSYKSQILLHTKPTKSRKQKALLSASWQDLQGGEQSSSILLPTKGRERKVDNYPFLIPTRRVLPESSELSPSTEYKKINGKFSLTRSYRNQIPLATKSRKSREQKAFPVCFPQRITKMWIAFFPFYLPQNVESGEQRILPFYFLQRAG